MAKPRTIESAELTAALTALPGWELREGALFWGHAFTDFVEAWSFLEKIARISEALNHHAEIRNAYNRVSLRLLTHDTGSITQRDLTFARIVAALESSEGVQFPVTGEPKSVPVRVRNTSTNPLPAYQTSGSAGLDVCAALASEVRLKPGERQLVPTGLFLEVPAGYEMQVRPRSGLALAHGITLLNTPGTIDSDYRGELGILVINLGSAEVVVAPGMRIAQLVLAPVIPLQWVESETLATSERGEGGFGHTGTSP